MRRGFGYKEGRCATTYQLSYGPQRVNGSRWPLRRGSFAAPPRTSAGSPLRRRILQNVLTSGKIKVAGTHLNLVERDNVEVGLDKAWAAQGPPRGELIVAVPTPNAAGFIMEIEI